MMKRWASILAIIILCSCFSHISYAETNGKKTLADLHNELEAEGWVLQSTTTETIPASVYATLRTTYSLNSDIVIEDVRATTSHYTQPIQTKSSYNSALLDGISNYGSLVTTVIASGMPSAKWIPRSVGFISQKVVELSARSVSQFSLAQTLYVYCIEVKREGWPLYYVCVESDKLVATAQGMFTGYNEDGSILNGYASGSASWESPHYEDYDYLSAKAIEIALNDGYVWSETCDSSSGIRLN